MDNKYILVRPQQHFDCDKTLLLTKTKPEMYEPETSGIFLVKYMYIMEMPCYLRPQWFKKPVNLKNYVTIREEYVRF